MDARQAAAARPAGTAAIAGDGTVSCCSMQRRGAPATAAATRSRHRLLLLPRCLQHVLAVAVGWQVSPVSATRQVMDSHPLRCGTWQRGGCFRVRSHRLAATACSQHRARGGGGSTANGTHALRVSSRAQQHLGFWRKQHTPVYASSAFRREPLAVRGAWCGARERALWPGTHAASVLCSGYASARLWLARHGALDPNMLAYAVRAAAAGPTPSCCAHGAFAAIAAASRPP